MTVPDLPVKAPQARAANSSTTSSGQPASQRPTDTAAAATAFRTGAAGHPAASPAGLLPLCSHRHGAGLHRTAPAIHQAAPPTGNPACWRRPRTGPSSHRRLRPPRPAELAHPATTAGRSRLSPVCRRPKARHGSFRPPSATRLEEGTRGLFCRSWSVPARASSSSARR